MLNKRKWILIKKYVFREIYVLKVKLYFKREYNVLNVNSFIYIKYIIYILKLN